MASIAPSPKFQWIDENGNPGVGFKLYTRESGTDTPKESYTDDSESTLNTNPIILDSNGACDLHLGQGAYRLRLENASGGLVWEKDGFSSSQLGNLYVATIVGLKAFSPSTALSVIVLGYYAVGDGGGGIYHYNQTSTDTDNGGTVIIPDSLPALGRWILTYSEEVTFKQFGAKGDSIADGSFGTDDYNAISNCLLWSDSNSKNVRMTYGAYLIGTNVTIGSSTKLIKDEGALFSSATSKTVTISGRLEAYIDQMFGDNITAAFGSGSTDTAYPEWWGAVANTESAAAIQSAVNDCKSDRSLRLLFTQKYLINTTITFDQSGQHYVDMGGCKELAATPSNTTGELIWNGGNNDIMVELLEFQQSYFKSIFVNNRTNNATGIRGIVWHNSDNTLAAGSHNVIELLGIYGCENGIVIGDYTNDGYDSNIEAIHIINSHFYGVDKPILIDGNAQDNIIFDYVHNGGGISAQGSRDYIIKAARNGNGFYIRYAFIRIDYMTDDNAVIDIRDGEFRCDYISIEGAATCRAFDFTSDITAARGQFVIKNLQAVDTCVDSSSLAGKVDSRIGAVFIGCNFGANIQISRPVVSIGNVFKTGTGWVESGGSARILDLFPRTKASQASSLDTTNVALRTSDDSTINYSTAGAVISFDSNGRAYFRQNIGINKQGTANYAVESTNEGIKIGSNFQSDTSGNVTGAGNLVMSGNGPHAIGEAVSNDIQFKIGGNFTSSGAGGALVGLNPQVDLTANNGKTSYHAGTGIASNITTQDNSETITDVSNIRVNSPNITKGATDTITNASSIAVVDAPTEGTNNYAIHIKSGVLGLATYTVASVPAASESTGGMIFVSDENGGPVPAFSDGTNWRRVTDRTIIVAI